MKNIFLISIQIFLLSNLSAQTVFFDWGKTIGGSRNDEGVSILSHHDGTLFLVGNFEGQGDLGLGVNDSILNSSGSTDIFVQKLDSNGDFLWLKQIGGISTDQVIDMVIDTVGNIYLTGTFKDTVDFDSGIGVKNLIQNGGYDDSDIFVLKLDNNGDFIWVQQIGSSNTRNYSTAIAIDSDGFVYVTGNFSGSIDFDPSINKHIIDSGASNDFFIEKLDPYGNLVWVKNVDWYKFNASSVTIGNNNDVYITGIFNGVFDLQIDGIETRMHSENKDAIFILKFDDFGNFKWIKQFGGHYNSKSSKIGIDKNENIYIIGSFKDKIDIDPGPETIEISSYVDWTVGFSQDVFIQKLDSNGRFIWVRQLRGTKANSSIISPTAYIDSNGEIYTIGMFNNSVNFDPGNDEYILTPPGNQNNSDLFIQKIDSNGEFSWATQMNRSSIRKGTSITKDNNGNLYLTGAYQGINDFDPATDTSIVISLNYDVFLQKLNLTDINTGVNTISKKLSFSVYPNPTKENLVIQFDKPQTNISYKIFSPNGQVIQTMKNINTQSLKLQLDAPNGLYYLEIFQSNDKRDVMKIVKQ